MASLTFNEKQLFARLFEMEGGYLLDFSTSSLQEFMNDFEIDLGSHKYDKYGLSKAKRFRAFWEVEADEVIFSWSGSLVVDVWCGGKVALNQHLFKVTSDEYAKWFYYYWTKQHLMNFQRVAAAKAVTMGHIKRSHLAEALCVVPDDAVFGIAEKMIDPLLEKLILNRLEVNDLQKTRDTLLPKLLSSELDVSKLKIEEEN